MKNEVIDIIKQELEISNDINENTDFQRDLGLDSLDIFQISLALQQKYNVKINEKYNTVGELVKIMEKKVE